MTGKAFIRDKLPIVVFSFSFLSDFFL